MLIGVAESLAIKMRISKKVHISKCWQWWHFIQKKCVQHSFFLWK